MMGQKLKFQLKFPLKKMGKLYIIFTKFSA